MINLTRLFLTAGLVAGLAVVGNAQLTISNSIFVPGGSSNGGGLGLNSAIGQPFVGNQSTGSQNLNSGFFFPAQNQPLQINLIALQATIPSDGSNPLVTWSTAMELNNAGFRVFRAEGAPGNWTMGEELTSGLILGLGSEGSGADYTFVDPAPHVVGSGDRWYFLTDLDFSGRVSVHGPVRAADPASATTITEWMVLE